MYDSNGNVLHASQVQVYCLKIVIGVAIALGIVFGTIHYLNSKKVLGPSLAARRAASEGVTIKPVTIVPAKGKSASRRRLDGTGSFSSASGGRRSSSSGSSR